MAMPVQQRNVAAERAALNERIEGRTLCDILERNARENGDGPALSWKEGDQWKTLTWSGYREAVAEVAMGLAELGVERGDFVAIMARNRPEHVITDLAALHLGATPVSFYNTLAPDQISYLANHCEAKVAVLDGREFMERWEKVRAELPKLQRVVLIQDAEAFAEYGWVTSFADVRARGREALARDREAFERSWKQVKPDDLATVIYTSGTTGPPKGVMTTHRNALWTAATVELMAQETTIAWGPGEKYVSYLPLAHSFERLTGHWEALYLQAHVHFCPDILKIIEYLPQVRPFSFVAVPRLWEKVQAGISAAIAAEPNERRRKIAQRAIQDGIQAVRLAQQGKPLPLGLKLRRALWSRLVYRKILNQIGLDQCRLAITGAAPIAVEVIEFFHALGLELLEGYGMTENTAGATVNRPGRAKIGTVGPPLPGVEISLAPDGEVLIRGSNVSPGYYKDPEKNQEAFDADGWLHTGDVGVIDEDGYLRIIDRKKELIITAGGKNISPANIEGLLKQHPLVGDACAIGDRRPFVSALIVLDPEVAPAWAEKHGISARGIAELARDERVRAEVQKAVDAANQKLAGVEQVKKFTILPTVWGPESEELTPTLKLKRRVIHDKYAREIEALYRS